MRLLAPFAILIAALSFNTGSAHAEPYYPWCARYNAWTIVCGFVTRQQCQETVSGVGGYCQENVMTPPASAAHGSYGHKPRAHHRRKHRRH